MSMLQIATKDILNNQTTHSVVHVLLRYLKDMNNFRDGTTYSRRIGFGIETLHKKPVSMTYPKKPNATSDTRSIT
jgi:hypothetical protein